MTWPHGCVHAPSRILPHESVSEQGVHANDRGLDAWCVYLCLWVLFERSIWYKLSGVADVRYSGYNWVKIEEKGEMEGWASAPPSKPLHHVMIDAGGSIGHLET
jgi:hypothetical protein